ncbi:MAG: FAD-linked oxidase C-terminal domain-containing protein [Phycisphaeraceae bacterium]
MSAVPPVIKAMQDVVGVDAVLHDGSELRVYESDGFPIARGLPTVVVFPRTTEQVSACIRAAAAHDLPIVPRGSGTGLAGGAVAYGGGAIVCTSRMREVESIDIANRVAVVQAGVYNAALSEAVAAAPGGEYLHFSPDPSSQTASTVGGNAATNAGGINTLKHGVTSSHVLGVELVLPDGRIVQTTPGPLYDRPGPDVTGLLCGSEGTLGIITRVWCRLTPRPRHFRTVYAVFNSSYAACRSVADVIAAGIVPTSMEMMDSAMIRVVEDAFHYGFPTSAQALLLLEIDGIDAVLDEELADIINICRANDAGDVQQCADPARRDELWSARKRAFGAIGRISPSYCTQDACIPRSKLPEAIERIAELGKAANITITNVFHAGDGNVHPIMLFDEDDPEQVQRTLELSERILEYCISIGGTITGEHGVGIEKLHLMEKMFTPETIGTFQRLKRAFDPDGRINEGKLIPSDRVRIDLLPHKPTTPNVPGGALVAH